MDKYAISVATLAQSRPRVRAVRRRSVRRYLTTLIVDYYYYYSIVDYTYS